MDSNTLKILKQIKTYYQAFEHSRLNASLTQRMVSDHCNIRPSTLSTVFRYFKGGPIDKLSPGVIQGVLNKLKSGCLIEKEALVLNGRPAQKKDGKNALIPHTNYHQAKIGQAVNEGGDFVYMLNTYVSYRILEEMDAIEDEGTLHNWIVRQKKNVRLLVLKPDGKAMRLRIKADLGNSASITRKIMEGLEIAFQLQQQYPEQLEIRMMDELPGLTCVILKERLFYGLHYSYDHAENGPVFEITDNSHFIYETVKKHFDTLWSADRSQKLDENLFNQIKNSVQVAYDKLDYLLGEWEIFIHNLKDVYTGEKPLPGQAISSDIEKFILFIEKHPRDIYPKAVITLPNLERLTGSLVIEHLKDRDYAHVRFTDLTSLSIHLSFHCRFEGKTMYGCFTMSSGIDCCTGIMNMNKKEQGLPLLPSDISLAWKRQLSFSEGAFLSLQDVRNNIAAFERPFKYAGAYKVYSYGGNIDNTKHIKINWLYINEWGEAQYINQHHNRENQGGVLHGKATEIQRNTHIVFSLTGLEERKSYLIIHTDGYPSEKGRYYSAVHLGVSWSSQMPNGKRFLLELTDLDFKDVSFREIGLHSDEYKKIPDSIRNLLSGRIKNLLGFLRMRSRIFTLKDVEREWEHSFKMRDIFFDSACMMARRKHDTKKVLEMLFRAINHGFEHLDHFEKELAELAPGVLDEIRQMGEYKRLQNILSAGS